MNKVKKNSLDEAHTYFWKLAELQTVIAIGRHDYRTRVLGKRAAESI